MLDISITVLSIIGAIGLIAYGFFCFFYGRIEKGDKDDYHIY